jgi:GH15 family glucan-1,4-alpha-glucosidase
MSVPEAHPAVPGFTVDSQPIENHGVIGDLQTAALVGMDGSIDFLCFPRFDSPTVFAALLDSQNGGRFQIAPALAGGQRKSPGPVRAQS